MPRRRIHPSDWERAWIEYALPAYALHSSSSSSSSSGSPEASSAAAAAEYDRLISPPRTEFLDKGVIDIPASYVAFSALPPETRLDRMGAFGPRRRPSPTQERGERERGGSHSFLQFYLHIRSLEAYYTGQGTLAFRDPHSPRGDRDYIRFAKALSVNQDGNVRGREAGVFRGPVYLSEEVRDKASTIYLPNYHLITSITSDLSLSPLTGDSGEEEVLEVLQGVLRGLEENGATRFINIVAKKSGEMGQVAAYTNDLFYLRNRDFILNPQMTKEASQALSGRLNNIWKASASGNLYVSRLRTGSDPMTTETEEDGPPITMEYMLRGNRESICNGHEAKLREYCTRTAALFMKTTARFIPAAPPRRVTTGLRIRQPSSSSPSPSSCISSLGNRRGGVFLTANPTRVHIDPTITILRILDLLFREEAAKACRLSPSSRGAERARKSTEEGRPRPIVLWISSHSGTVGSRIAAAKEESDVHWRPGEEPVQMQLDEYIRNILRLAWDHVPSVKPRKGASSFVGRYPGDAEVLGALDSIFGPMVSADEEARKTGETYGDPSRRPRARDGASSSSSSAHLPPASYRFISHDEFFGYCSVAFRESSVSSRREPDDDTALYKDALGLFFGAQPTEAGLTFQRVGAFYNMILVIDDLPGFWGHEHVLNFRLCLENEASRGKGGGHFPLLMFICRDGGELFYSHPANAWMSTLHECLSTLARFPVPLDLSPSDKEREKQQALQEEGDDEEGGGGIIPFESISDAPELGLTPYGGRSSSSRDDEVAAGMFKGIQRAHEAASRRFLYAGPPDGWQPGPSVIPAVRLTIEHYVPVTYVGAQQLLLGPPVPGRGWDGMAHDLELQIARRFEAIDLEDCGYVHLPSWKFKDSDCTKPVTHLHTAAAMTDQEQ